MAYDYDELYGSTPNALGEPTPIFVDFFDKLGGKQLKVLDIGCGQGRDALFIARMGHSVTGVDISPNGIREMCEIAKRERLSVDGIVADINDFSPAAIYDVLLIDRTLHMLAEPDRLDVLDRLLDCVGNRGRVLIADERRNIPSLAAVLTRDGRKWEIFYSKRGYLFAQRV